MSSVLKTNKSLNQKKSHNFITNNIINCSLVFISSIYIKSIFLTEKLKGKIYYTWQLLCFLHLLITLVFQGLRMQFFCDLSE